MDEGPFPARDPQEDRDGQLEAGLPGFAPRGDHVLRTRALVDRFEGDLIPGLKAHVQDAQAAGAQFFQILWALQPEALGIGVGADARHPGQVAANPSRMRSSRPWGTIRASPSHRKTRRCLRQ